MGVWRSAGLALEFGFIVGGFMTTGVLAGRFLDQQLGTRPFLLLGGILLGLGMSGYTMYLLYKWQK